MMFSKCPECKNSLGLVVLRKNKYLTCPSCNVKVVRDERGKKSIIFSIMGLPISGLVVVGVENYGFLFSIPFALFITLMGYIFQDPLVIQKEQSEDLKARQTSIINNIMIFAILYITCITLFHFMSFLYITLV